MQGSKAKGTGERLIDLSEQADNQRSGMPARGDADSPRSTFAKAGDPATVYVALEA
ncbi:MAG: hypothetical protein HYX97_01785 [Chloroflexi bacterium]|nr:hypothetical protein [Chloroflexota bacterium]